MIRQKEDSPAHTVGLNATIRSFDTTSDRRARYTSVYLAASSWHGACTYRAAALHYTILGTTLQTEGPKWKPALVLLRAEGLRRWQEMYGHGIYESPRFSYKYLRGREFVLRCCCCCCVWMMQQCLMRICDRTLPKIKEMLPIYDPTLVDQHYLPHRVRCP